MARSFPLVRSAFWDNLKIRSAVFTLGESRQNSITGGGEIMSAQLGTRLWSATVNLIPATHAKSIEIEANIEALLTPSASFHAYDSRQIRPASDPNGTIITGSTPLLNAVNANMRDVTISGLPANYVLTAGDKFSFSYGSSPTRYALHRIVSSVNASGAGVATVEVVPPVRQGFALGDVVTFFKPYMMAKIVPSTYIPATGNPGRLSDGISFQIMQTLRP